MRCLKQVIDASLGIFDFSHCVDHISDYLAWTSDKKLPERVECLTCLVCLSQTSHHEVSPEPLPRSPQPSAGFSPHPWFLGLSPNLLIFLRLRFYFPGLEHIGYLYFSSQLQLQSLGSFQCLEESKTWGSVVLMLN